MPGQLTTIPSIARLGWRLCPSPAYQPLVLLQFLSLDAKSSSNKACDSSPPGLALDGLIRVRNLTTVFTGSKEDLRGVCTRASSTGPWTAGGRITGTLEGISNAGSYVPNPSANASAVTK